MAMARRQITGRPTGRLTRLAAVGSSALTFAVVVAPAAAVVLAGKRGGVADPAQADLLTVGAVVGGVAAVLAWRRAPRVLAGAGTATSGWIAALWALVTTAVGSSLLPPLALHTLAGGLDSDSEWATPAVWAGCLVAAVAAGEGVHRAVRRWLTGAQPTEGGRA